MLTRKRGSGLFGSDEESTAEYKIVENSNHSGTPRQHMEVNLGQIFSFG
jgi:hypothetical protein